MLRGSLTALPVAALVIGICFCSSPARAAEVTAKEVIKTYADIAQADYEDSLETANTLKLAVEAFLAEPTEGNLRAARAAGSPHASLTCRPKPIASATPLSTIGKAR
jgi:uncharacterized iron-regulated protein